VIFDSQKITEEAVMRTVFLSLAALAAIIASGSPHETKVKSTLQPPPIPREFRAAWVATVDNIDWPSKRGIPVEQQRAEILRILDKASQLNLNAIILQVRPSCDALYPSKLEPWSEYLTGRQGKAPDPFYDPLEMWVEEAHKRSIELHAWLNPYRARHPSAKQPVCSDHLLYKKPRIVRTYGKHLWLDPGEPETQKHSLAVIMDVVKRYDLDGIHMDDYFYPYKEKDAAGVNIDFPDDESYRKYCAANKNRESLGRDDWRRWNVDQFIERVYRSIKKEKKHVKFGISPFGIWRPGNPPQIQGMDQYSMLYADARKWIREGWCDYWTPQLYWPIAQTAQSYPVLLNWWMDQNLQHRNIWPGNYTSRIDDGSRTEWKASELIDQIKVTRKAEAGGNVHFSMITLMQNRGGVSDALRNQVYTQPALIPGSPWLGEDRPAPPEPKLKRESGSLKLELHRGNSKRVWQWAIQWKYGSAWRTEIVPGTTKSCAPKPGADPDAVAVTAVDRVGIASEPTVIAVGE
jgi:uncharacterized lipoprotein YddW (UPF0748 family)